MSANCFSTSSFNRLGSPEQRFWLTIRYCDLCRRITIAVDDFDPWPPCTPVLGLVEEEPPEDVLELLDVPQPRVLVHPGLHGVRGLSHPGFEGRGEVEPEVDVLPLDGGLVDGDLGRAPLTLGAALVSELLLSLQNMIDAVGSRRVFFCFNFYSYHVFPEALVGIGVFVVTPHGQISLRVEVAGLGNVYDHLHGMRFAVIVHVG